MVPVTSPFSLPSIAYPHQDGGEVHGPEVVDGGDEQPPDEPDAEAMSRSAAKKAFDILRKSFENTAELATHLFLDRKLQLPARIICDCLQFLHKEYVDDADAHSEGPHVAMQWQAERAMGSFHKTICKMLKFLQGPDLISRLDLQPKRALVEPQRTTQPSAKTLHWRANALTL